MFTAVVAFLIYGYQSIFGVPIAQQIDRYLSTEQFQGAVLVAQAGKVILCKGYGYANLEHKIPNCPSTVFRIGSITKQFTAVAILQLQEQGLLHVHDPVEKFLPGYPHGNEITIHHLLTHTSGLAEITDFPNLSTIQRLPSTPETVIAYLHDLPLEFPPGTCCTYCNSGYIVLGAIIETVTGLSYERYLHEQVFTPLHLAATDYDLPEKVIPHRAHGYRVTKNTLAHAEFIDMSFPHASGGLASSIEDLYAWNTALHAGKLLSPQSLNAMFSQQSANAKGTLTYGYGVCIGPHNQGLTDTLGPVTGHFGSIEGFRSALIYYPEADITLVILSNHENTNVRSLQHHLSSLFSQASSWR